MRLWRSVTHAETKHFRVWLAVLSLLCFTFSGEVSAAHDQVDAPTYRIAAGDTIQIGVWMEPGYTSIVRVDGDGNINLPAAHNLKVLGLSAADLTNLLHDKLRDKISNPRVWVRVTPHVSEPRPVPLVLLRLYCGHLSPQVLTPH
jgi:protein involved in polysaccharide export with SLBB domain